MPRCLLVVKRPSVLAAVRIVVGALFLATAILKIQGLRAYSLEASSWYVHPLLQAVVSEWELILGLWLVWGLQPLGSWLCALGTATSFGLFSLYLGLLGRASCGCFGQRAVSPWVSLGLDVAVVFVLLLCRPDVTPLLAEPAKRIRLHVRRAAAVVAGGVAIIAVSMLVASVVFGSVNAALAHLRDEPLSVSPALVDFGSAHPRMELEANVEIANWTRAPVRIVGGSADCSCLATGSLPVVIPSNGARTVVIKFRVPPALSGGRLQRLVLLFTDLQDHRTLRVPVACRVVLP